MRALLILLALTCSALVGPYQQREHIAIGSVALKMVETGISSSNIDVASARQILTVTKQ